MGIGGIAAIVAQTPVGAAADRTTAKRALIVAGAALSNIIAGWIVAAAGYDAAFISLGVSRRGGLGALYWAAMPETGPNAATPGLPRTGEA